MHISISPQILNGTYTQSVGDYVTYLEKENKERSIEMQEHFFDQNNDQVSTEEVIREIDNNTKKLRQRDPRFYSIVVSPSPKELAHIQGDSEKLKTYTRELMKQYAKAFHRNQEVRVEDLKYYAKIEHQRTYRGFEKKIQENAPYRKEIARLQNNIQKIHRGEIEGNIKKLEKQIRQLTQQAPHKLRGELIKEGMQKEGLQTHIHIIVSRRDQSNTYTLSPLSKHKTSEVTLNGKTIKRGFDRNQFYQAAEKTFDRTTGYRRNYIETYMARKQRVYEPKKFYAHLLGLPTRERQITLKLLRETGIQIPVVPTNQMQLSMQLYKRIERAIQIAERSVSIEI